MSEANTRMLNQEVVDSTTLANVYVIPAQSASIENRESAINQDFLITVTNPHKVGNGIDAYLVYTVSTQTTPKSKNVCVDRRFKDFLSLHEKLVNEHKTVGHLVPPPPEKSVVGMTLVKLSKHNDVDFCFIEKRRAALERYLNRIARNPILGKDTHFIDFLEQRGMLVRASQFNVLSAANVKDLVKSIEVFSPDNTKIDEKGWFKEKHDQLYILMQDIKLIHESFERLIRHHRSVYSRFTPLTTSLSNLAYDDPYTPAAHAFKQITIAYDAINCSHELQSNSDYYNVSEILYDHLRIINEISSLFDSRLKHWQQWKKYAEGLDKVKKGVEHLEENHDVNKALVNKERVDELEAIEDAKKLNFSNYSSVIRADVMSYKKTLSADFNGLVLTFIGNMIKRHEQNIKIWETFLTKIEKI